MNENNRMNPEDKFFAEKGKKGSTTIETVSLSVKELSDSFNEGKISLDYYQREFVYDAKKYEKASKVIETILFGKVIPAIVYRQNENRGAGYFEIIDGQQRTLSIVKFLSNEFALNLKETDDAYMLNGYRFSDLSPRLKRELYEYRITAMRIVTTSSEIVTEIFLDLNYQPVAITEEEISTSILFGEISKKARELTTYRDTIKINFTIWALFGHQNKYYGDDGKRFKILVKDKRGTISIAVLRTMLNFIDKEIVINQDNDWIKYQLSKSKDNPLDKYSLHNFENYSNYIFSLFRDEIRNEPKEKSPFFYKQETSARAKYLQHLPNILYLGVSSIYENYILDIKGYSISQRGEIDKNIKNLFNAIKPEIVNYQENQTQLNVIKDNFINKLNLIINNKNL